MAASRDRIRSLALDRGHIRRARRPDRGHIRRGLSRIRPYHHRDPGRILPARRRLRIGEADGMSTRSLRPLPLA